MLFNRNPNAQFRRALIKMDETDLLKQFRNENFSKLVTEQKIVLLQELEKREAKIQGRDPSPIILETQDRYGAYYPDENVISIDIEQNPYEILDTYYHESRHAQQYYAAKNGKGLDEDTFLTMKADIYGDYEESNYDLSSKEIDANVVASKRIIEKSNLFEDDYKYYHYLEKRTQHYEHVINENNKNPQLRKMELMTKANRAEFCGNITLQEMEHLHDKAKENDEFINSNYDILEKIKQKMELSNNAIVEKQNKLIPPKNKTFNEDINSESKVEKLSELMRGNEIKKNAEKNIENISSIANDDSNTNNTEKNNSDKNNQSLKR